MTERSLAQWLVHLEAIHPAEIELGLDRIRTVAHALNLLPYSLPVVTIAGTNGKGSTAAVLERLLTAHGMTTGLSTSPHFLCFNERIRVNGVAVSDTDIAASFARIEEARGDTTLTYFEFATLASLLIFLQHSADIAILEVGLGGRLDAMNLVDADVAVITSIALDHQDWLGDSREAIGREKAGVARVGKPVVVADTQPPDGLIEFLQDLGATSLCIGTDFGATADSAYVSLGHDTITLPCIVPPALRAENVAAALQVAALLGVNLAALDLATLVQAAAPIGRLQRVIRDDREYILDVAHNPAAVENLVKYLRENPTAGKTFALFSVMADKDIHAMMRRCKNCFDTWLLADLAHVPRAAGSSQVASILIDEEERNIVCFDALDSAFADAQFKLQAHDRLVVFGSFHTVAGVLPLLGSDRRETGN
ncbi:MAG: folylpolyglutamate synthase/dihydrofolate synthase family protein [Halioglobus sp.]